MSHPRLYSDGALQTGHDIWENGDALSHLALGPQRDRDLGRLDLGTMDSGTGITGGGSGYAVILAHAGGLLSGTELGLVTLKRVGLFFFQLNTQHTHS